MAYSPVISYLCGIGKRWSCPGLQVNREIALISELFGNGDGVWGHGNYPVQ